MRRSRNVDESNDSGQDSFLDIVANLVGILIILVMVVGVRAKDAMVEAAISSTASSVDQVDVEAPRSIAKEVQTDIHTIQAKLREVQTESQLQMAYRHQLAAIFATVEHQLGETRGKLDTTTRERLDLAQELSKMRGQLEDLERAEEVLQRHLEEPIPLKHLPTPLAKTVFGKEVHFQLKEGRICYVPLTEFVEQLSAEWQQKVWKLKDTNEIVEMAGPIQGFRMQYGISKTVAAVNTRSGTQRREMVHVSGFVLLPVRDDLGQSLSDALQPNSSLRQILAGYDPHRTTITLWTYPDSFEAFRKVREELYRLGYSSAGRPIPEGYPIGGSPNGSRSAAQ